MGCPKRQSWRGPLGETTFPPAATTRPSPPPTYHPIALQWSSRPKELYSPKKKSVPVRAQRTQAPRPGRGRRTRTSCPERRQNKQNKNKQNKQNTVIIQHYLMLKWFLLQSTVPITYPQPLGPFLSF